MASYYIYQIRREGTEHWYNITGYVNSKDTKINNDLCSKEFKSVTNTASFKIRYIGNRQTEELSYRELLDYILSARSDFEKIECRIYRSYAMGEISSGSVVLFDGYVDDSDISITSSMIPESIELSCSDKITLLDNDIKANLVYDKRDASYAPNGITVNALVRNLLAIAGYEGEVVSYLPDDRYMPYFVVTEDDETTFRDVIDTLLFEMPGYVLYRNPKDQKYYIMPVQTESTSTPRTVSYLGKKKIQTKNGIYDYDGITVVYPTVEVKTAQSVYTSDISIEYDDDMGKYVGDEIAPLDYWPEDADVQATYQEYEKDLLDKPYNEGTSRVQNSDLDLMYVRNAEIRISATGNLDYPVLAGIDMVDNPTFYPRKCWALLHNPSPTDSVYLNAFTVVGDATYKSKLNKLSLPASASNTEEYETSYIFTEAEAEAFASFYYKFKTISKTTTSWYEYDGESYLGEIVNVVHKDSPVGQAHVIVGMQDYSLDGDIRAVKVTAVAISDYNAYEYKKTSTTYSTAKKKGIQTDKNEYYNSDSDTELIGGEWSDTLTVVEGKTVWVRRVVQYTDNSVYISEPYPSGKKGTDGANGADGTFLSLEVSNQVVDYYADNVIVDDSEITVTAQSDLSITLKIDNMTVASESSSIVYSFKPSAYLNSKTSINVVASTSRMRQSYTIRKNLKTGLLTLTADKTSIGFYADNVPHDTTDKITLAVASDGYKGYPKLYLDGGLEKEGTSTGFTYEIPYSRFNSKDSITAKVILGSDVQTITLYKTVDSGSMSITATGDSFAYYADNEPHNSTDYITLSIAQSGYSTMPKLYINDAEKSYSIVGNTGTYTVLSTDIGSVNSLLCRIENDLESQYIVINKIKDTPELKLSLSEGAVEYYADNVAITGNITATVTYKGLYYAPMLTAGSTGIALTDGVGTIPISLFDSDSLAGLNITAYAQKSISMSTSVYVPKIKRALVLSMGLSAAQFSYDSAGNISPSSIDITNNTTGLSDKSKVTLLIGGTLCAWNAEGKYTLTPDMITGRYITATVSYLDQSSSAVITKTYDGKAETVEYSKTKSFKIYPDESYEFVYSDTGMEYNGDFMAWVVPWSSDIPDCGSNEYVWRRSRTSEHDEWSYTRMTGIKGEDGKAGEYLGYYTEAPSYKPDGSEVNDGDYYLNISEAGNPLPYIMRNGTWVLVTSDDKQWSAIASATMDDVNNFGGSLLSTSSYYGFFQALSAQSAFIKSLSAQEITLTDNGAIQSSTYAESGGADGFRIEADGDVDFNTGVWRGAFSNGFSFVPPTRFKIDKTMTNKEAYQVMRRAGVHNGRFVQYTREYTPPAVVYEGGQIFGRMPAHASFTCLDYDESKSDTAIPYCIGKIVELTINRKATKVIQAYDDSTIYYGSIVALDIDKWIVEKMKVNSSGVGFDHQGYYLLKKADLETALNTELSIANGLSDCHISMTKIDALDFVLCSIGVGNDPVETSNNRVECYNYMYVSQDGNMLIGSDASGNIHRFSYSESAGTVVDDGAISISGLASNEKVIFSRFILPLFYCHDKGDGSVYFSVMKYTDGDLTHIAIASTTDYLNYTVSNAVSVAGLLSDDNFFPLDAVLTANGDMLMVASFTDSSDSQRYVNLFYGVASTGNWTELGRGRVAYKDDSSVDSSEMIVNVKVGGGNSEKISMNIAYTNIYVQGNYALVSILGHNLYRVNLTTLEIDNLTRILADFVPKIGWPIYSQHNFLPVFYVSAKDYYDLYLPSHTVDAIAYDRSVGKALLFLRLGTVGYQNYGAITNFFYLDIETLEAEQFSPFLIRNSGDASYYRYPNAVPMIAREDGRASYAESGIIYLKHQSFTHCYKTLRNRKVKEYRAYCQEQHDNTSVDWILKGTSYPIGLHNLVDNDASLLGQNVNAGYNASGWGLRPIDYVEKNEALLVASEDGNIAYESAFPIINASVIDVRDTGTQYQICIAGYAISSLSDGTSITANLGNFGYSQRATALIEMAGGVKALPFITIDKDSEEPIGATFYWNFPAQIILDDSIQHIESSFLGTFQ
jgi:hypothetical protein